MVGRPRKKLEWKNKPLKVNHHVNLRPAVQCKVDSLAKDFNDKFLSEDVMSLSFEEFDALIARDDLKVDTEWDVFVSCMAWVEHDNEPVRSI